MPIVCGYCEGYDCSRPCCSLGVPHTWYVHIERDEDGDVMHRCSVCGVCTYELREDLD
jgi:hypothetical protein